MAVKKTSLERIVEIGERSKDSIHGNVVENGMVTKMIVPGLSKSGICWIPKISRNSMKFRRLSLIATISF